MLTKTKKLNQKAEEIENGVEMCCTEDFALQNKTKSKQNSNTKIVNI